MARIRTIKPEFWTDEKVVQLPFEARLLFIGLWNFADDDGYLPDEPDRIQLQVLPADQVDCDLLLDLLVAADLLEKLDLSDGRTALRISGFDRHQKISHKTPTKLPIAGAKKRSVSTPIRRDIAIKYGCKPGEALEVSCYYCGSPGSIHWFRLRNGRPSSWVAFGGMEIDHFTPESDGGETRAENLVLSCRYCNRSKGTKGGIAFISKALPSPPENSGEISPDLGRELKGRELKGRELKGKEAPPDDVGRPTPETIPLDFTPNEVNRKWMTDAGMSERQQADVVGEFVRWASNSGLRRANWQQTFSRNPAVKSAIGRAKSAKPSVAANFDGKEYTGTADDELPSWAKEEVA